MTEMHGAESVRVRLRWKVEVQMQLMVSHEPQLWNEQFQSSNDHESKRTQAAEAGC